MLQPLCPLLSGGCSRDATSSNQSCRVGGDVPARRGRCYQSTLGYAVEGVSGKIKRDDRTRGALNYYSVGWPRIKCHTRAWKSEEKQGKTRHNGGFRTMWNLIPHRTGKSDSACDYGLLRRNSDWGFCAYMRGARGARLLGVSLFINEIWGTAVLRKRYCYYK